MKRFGIGLVAMTLVVASACAKVRVHGEEVTYTSGGDTLKGYVAYNPELKGKRPGVLVVHEWWGNNEYSRKRANMLAELGYTALAVDMYGEGKMAKNPDEAGKMSGAAMKDFERTKERFEAGMEYLKAHGTVDAGKLAAIGYCFGGGVALNMARQGADLKGVVSFHGSLDAVKPAAKGAVKARLLVEHGGADKFIPDEKVAALKKEMADAGADMQFVVQPGATHVFTNPEADRYAKEFKMPIAYSPEGDRKSWDDMKKFLADVLK